MIIMKIKVTYDKGFGGTNYKWLNSSPFDKLTREYRYRGWIHSEYQYMLACDETMKIIESIKRLMESGVNYEFEPEIPNCRMICGKFIINVQDLINGAVGKWARSNYVEKYVYDMFKEFAWSTMVSVVEKEIGSIEEGDSKSVETVDEKMKSEILPPELIKTTKGYLVEPRDQTYRKKVQRKQIKD
jgi:hypothetical protein